MNVYEETILWCQKRLALKEERERQVKGDSPVTKAFFVNVMDGHFGGVSQLFETSHTLLIQRLNDLLTAKVNDTAVLVRNVLMDKLETLQHWMDHSWKLMDSIISETLATYNTAAEARHAESEHNATGRMGVIMRHIAGLFRHQQAMSTNDHHRFVVTQDRLAFIEATMNYNANQQHNLLVALHANLTKQIQTKQRVVIEYRPQPTLDWMMDHADEICRFAKALTAVKENLNPPNQTMLEVVKSARSMLDVSIDDIRTALDDKAREWGVA
jgi:hypothetical protein